MSFHTYSICKAVKGKKERADKGGPYYGDYMSHEKAFEVLSKREDKDKCWIESTLNM